MFLPLLSLVLAQFVEEPSATGRIDGLCLYPEVVRERALGDTLVDCNQARVEEGGITFGRRGWQQRTRFIGSFEHDRLTVTALQFRDRAPDEARGVCQLYYANDHLTTIACTATTKRQLTTAANFVVSRI